VYLVHGFDDPIDAGITADGFVLRVHEDDLKVLVRRVLIDPVGVEHAQVGTAAADALFGSGFEGALVFQLVDPLVGWFAWFSRKDGDRQLGVFLLDMCGRLDRGGTMREFWCSSCGEI